ncbi:glycosyltransferase family 4 protein [Pedobacter glucosidilyticus]|uniref:glycosyltransferase family 4 protein n=1 Tax=Pedobacter glucosidilyticus TaxID=1122941 RepID=UPI0004085280|nr:glycosyltransferase family 4 protein [Pedobacter glucosidilyticus]
MKVLLLTNRVPFPPHGGYAIVVYNTIKELIDLGGEVTLFSLNTTKHFVKTKEIKDPVFKKIKFVQYKIDNRVKVKDAFLNLFTGESYNLSRFYEKNCASKLAHLLRTQDFDIIQFEGLQVVPYLDIVKAVSKAKIIYRAHNIEHQIWKRLTLQENFFLRKMYFNLLSKRLQKFEFKILNSFNAIITISAVDEHFFKSVGCQSPVHTFPVALDLEKYNVQQNPSLHKSIGYIGSMDWRPNLEGIDWFLEKVWPSIKQLDAGITFHLAGKNMPKYLEGLNSESFILEGEVDDATAFIARQHVLIVPLLSGSGMRVKIIEAMALGKCIIATSIAAEGIHYQHDVNILIADKADDFYKQILRCFTDKTLISRIGKEAKKLVAKYHNNKMLSKDLLNVYEAICDKKP